MYLNNLAMTMKTLQLLYSNQLCSSTRTILKKNYVTTMLKKSVRCNPLPKVIKNTCQLPAVAINGFGRIGKCLLRLAFANDVNVVAVNQPFTNVKAIAHSMKTDSVHGPFNGKIHVMEKSFCVNGKNVHVFHEEKPENIKWKDVPVDYVIDSTGKFTDMEAAKKHITAGAKKVIITAPSKDAPMFVRGVNFNDYKINMNVVSNSSCTTNCAAPLIQIMNKKFGIINCLFTTTHSMTASQSVHDGLSNRAASVNIIPTSTGAATSVSRVIPELKGKIDGDAARVPTMDVSLLKLYMNFKEKTSLEEIKSEIKKQAECSYKDIVTYYDGAKYVSWDFVGYPYSAIVDFNQIFINDKFVSIGAWYDNEMAYSYRVLDLLKHIVEVDKQ